MSKNLINKLSGFEHYSFDFSNKNINTINISNPHINEFLEIIYILDSKFINYEILNDFNISILEKNN